LEAAIAGLEAWGAARGWVGPDPYEALNARSRLAAPLRRWPLSRRLLIQLVKRSPLDLRRPLAIAPRPDAAAFAHLLSAQALLGARDRMAAALEQLTQLRCRGFEQPCWGYGFDVETRFFFYAAETPNSIATAFAGLALLDAERAGAGAGALELATGAGEYFLRHTPQTEAPTGSGAYFGYLPGDRSPIHNANLLVCALLTRLGARTGERRFSEAAAAGVRYALAHQRADGSWPYAEDPRGKWVDGLHSGYVLDALAACEAALGDPGIAAARRRGLDFYRRHLICADGAAAFLRDGRYPIDSQTVAQAIASFARAELADGEGLATALRVFSFASERMRRSDGAFLFQRGRLLVKPTPHVRWVQAPMLEALCLLRKAAQARSAAAPGEPL
jgi:hypothetical protein